MSKNLFSMIDESPVCSASGYLDRVVLAVRTSLSGWLGADFLILIEVRLFCAEVIFSITLSTNLFLVSSSTRFEGAR